jgi:orotate phosphoribosyltransferase
MPPAKKPAPAESRRTTRRPEPSGVDAEVRERIHLEILRRTGAYRTDDHFLLPSGHHAPEFIDKALVTTEPTFTEGLGAIIAKHFAEWPVDVVLSTGPGALILAHCVARALPARPTLAYATKGMVTGTARTATGPQRRVRLPEEFERFVGPGTKILIVEDLITTGETIKLLIQLVEEAGGSVVGIGCLWQRASKIELPAEVFSLVTRDFPTYEPAACPLCRQGRPINVEFAGAWTPSDPPATEAARPRA